MENLQTAEKEKILKSDKRATMILIAAAFIILGAVFICIALRQPKISSPDSVQSTVPITETVSQIASAVTDRNETQSSTAVQNNAAPTTAYSVKFPLNLNTCTAEDLMRIDKIGETRANAIIAYRDYLGGYTSVEQIKNISGIGDSVYAAIEPYVTV